MSIKDDLNYVKAELSADEKVLESAFRLEHFFKKYKKLIIGTVTVIVVSAVAYNGYEAYKDAKLEAANAAYDLLQNDPKNTQALETLKSNAPLLYAHYRLMRAVEASSAEAVSESIGAAANDILKDMARYHEAVLSHKTTQSELYHDLALLEEALQALRRHDISKARSMAERIAPDSPLASEVVLLKHALIKAK